MKAVSFAHIARALDHCSLPRCDMVLGIASGGIIPAALVAKRIGCGVEVIKISYRDSRNIPQFPEPVVKAKVRLPAAVKNILLVDDASVSGKTLRTAKKLFKRRKVTTMVFKGKADIVLFPDIDCCVRWPWSRCEK
jgi:hypoxanthine phosphoribosyltransferase